MPLGAIFKTEVSLDENVIGVERLVPEAVWADALKMRTEPCVSEVLLEGSRLIFPGKRGGPALPPPPQPLTVHSERSATANRQALERDLPMHPL
jgi:hypothetical protein